MKGDTSIQRILLLLVISILALPYVMQVFMTQGNLFPDEAEIESQQLFFELKSISKLITYHHNQTGDWPATLSEMSHSFGQPQYQNIDLSSDYLIISTPNERIKSPELTGTTIVFRYGMNWHCDAELTTIPDAYKPIECGGSMSSTMRSVPEVSTFYIIAFFAIIGIIIAVVFYHPTIRLLRGREFSLASQRLVDLKKLHVLTRLSGLHQHIYDANDINANTWYQMANFCQLKAAKKINWFKRIWPQHEIKPIHARIQHIKLDPEFVLNLNDFYLYIAPKNTRISRIKSHFKQTDISHQVVLIWAEDADLNHQLLINRSRFQQPIMIPDQQQLTQLLVTKYVDQVLIDLMVAHIPINQLAPYQGKGGIIKSSHFYGREQILDQLKSKPQSCFLLVGGRQLGKTSILKAYERSIRSAARQHCFYISMSDDRLLPRLSHHLKITDYSDLSDLLNQYHSNNPGISLTLLLDESDRFIATEVQHNFPLLAEIRACAEQGLCQMVFAGFWDLYASAVLDYHSPIKNFAEVITVGALEAKPARSLLTRPMKVLKQRFSNERVINNLLHQTGQRANLINLACEFLVDQLAHQAQVIDEQMVKRALMSQPLFDALQGWSNLTHDPQASSLDRIVVYLTFIHQAVDIPLIIDQLQQAEIQIESEHLKQALHRLRLAHILYKKNNQYVFPVPLFAQQHSPQEAATLLHQELRFLRT